MTIYNITTQVAWAIHDRWKQWLIEEALPEMLSTGLFTHFQLVRLIEVNEEEGPTYAVQLYSTGAAELNLFRKNHLPEFDKNERGKWGDSICSFKSVMEVIN